MTLFCTFHLYAKLEYSYDLNQRLAWRKFWQNGSTAQQTYYAYDPVGNLTNINYPTSPDVTFAYNEVNKMSAMTTAGLGTSTFTYTDEGSPLAEYGLWASDGVTNVYHASVPRLKTGLSIAQPSTYWSQTCAYDAARRLTNVVSPAGTFAYRYKGPGNLWTNLGLPNSAAITNVHDSGGRLTGTYLKNSGGTNLNQHVYLYNSAGQRKRQTLLDGTYTTYTYDNDGQLATLLGYTAGGSAITSEQLGFAYDPGWNLTNRSVNGTAAAYAVNDRNQLTSTPLGSASYDPNGNLTSCVSPYGSGSVTRICTYDEENRLISAYAAGVYRSVYTYDGLGRVRVRTDYTWSGSSWTVSATVRYLYDGMRVVQERDGSNVPTVTYTRGSDLSGTLEGAGGIGGLLARSHGYSAGSWGTHNFYHADGGGNITFLVSSAQTNVASYKYDPFGRTISSSGSLASANTYRFSSKEAQPNSGLYYYGYRFYDPNTQRWLNRDPIGEDGGMNLYTPFGNEPVDEFDAYGLFKRNGRTITVEGCEIVIVYGHGTKGDPFKFNFPPGGDSAAGAVLCFNRETNCKIRQENRIPNAPDDPGLILWEAPLPTDSSRVAAEDSGLPSGNSELEDIIRGARQRAGELVKSGKCKTVTIRFIRVPDNLFGIFPDRHTPACPSDIRVQAPRTPKPAPKPNT